MEHLLVALLTEKTTIAALETLKLMKKLKSWEIISKIGRKIKQNWSDLAKQNRLNIKIQGLDHYQIFILVSNHNLYKTYISQEMLKKILASNAVYTCIDHNHQNLKDYFSILDDVLKKLKNVRMMKKIFLIS